MEEEKYLTAQEANRITLLKEPELLQRQKDEDQECLVSIFNGIRSASSTGQRRCYIYPYPTNKYIIDTLIKLGYRITDGIGENARVLNNAYIHW